MEKNRYYDLAIIGGGAAGLSAASITSGAACRTLVIDREDHPGGILRQCIHNGFGLRYFKEELTGPEYAERVAFGAQKAGAEFALGTTVTDLKRLADGTFELEALSAKDGIRSIYARAVLLAMGCRERNRGNIATPGTRPAGVFTAGTAQKILNLEGRLPGKKAVIIGSGDIGLIMARRLCWCGIEVKGVVEIMPFPSGLTRNIVQCLNDFNIPLWLEHSVVEICGRDRVEGVEVAPLVNGLPNLNQKFHIDCDTLLFSVGLIPENELALSVGVKINPATGGAFVNGDYETSVPGIFSAGNVLHVHDLVDFVSEEAIRAGYSILRFMDGKNNLKATNAALAGANLKYVIPNQYFPGERSFFSFRPMIVTNNGTLIVSCKERIILKKTLPFVRPAEMINLELTAEQLSDDGELTFTLEKGTEAE